METIFIAMPTNAVLDAIATEGLERTAPGPHVEPRQLLRPPGLRRIVRDIVLLVQVRLPAPEVAFAFPGDQSVLEVCIPVVGVLLRCERMCSFTWQTNQKQ